MPHQDYPRMMFHRTRPPVTIHSQEEEQALGAEWSRTVFPPGEAEPPAAPDPPSTPKEPDAFSEPFRPPAPAPAPDAFEPEPRNAKTRPASKKAPSKKKR